MTNEDAYRIVEELFDQLPISVHQGGTLGFTEHSFPRVAEVIGERWINCIRDFQDGVLEPVLYVNHMAMMIREFNDRSKFSDDLERALVGIFEQQQKRA
jgi:hypothetical protein